MYAYEWDATTGGLLLTKTASKFSKEPRPVYYKELDILGFDKYWTYEKDDSFPYMWAEASQYIYRGRLVAKTIGGGLYTPPTLEVYEEGLTLRPIDIDAMVEKNSEIMESLVNETIKRVYSTFLEYKKKVDVFYVAFSGGKDSIALLDIVQRTLPHNEFLVVFGDTDMECQDTYKIRDDIEKFIGYEDIKFYTAKSHLKAVDSWDVFGPPASRLRWCCSVHKTTPQINALRGILEKTNFRGMAFTGIRRDESASRSSYDTLNLGKKHIGQYSMNAIDEWNTAELYLYIYSRKLLINAAYKNGLSRVGCLVCPMSSGKHEFMKEINYPKQVNKYIDVIRNKSNRKFDSQEKENEFIINGGWKVRNNGRDLKINNELYEELAVDNLTTIYFKHNDDWKIWISTIGELSSESKNHGFTIKSGGKEYFFTVSPVGRVFKVEIYLKPLTKEEIYFLSAFKIVFRKAAYCIQCGVCASNCLMGYIEMKSDLHISEKCTKCRKCHEIDSGCLVYNSVKVLKGVESKMSLDCYASFGVEKDWIVKYLQNKEGFWESEYNDLGSMKITALKRFLRDSGIKLEKSFKNNERDFSLIMNSTIDSLGHNNPLTWALLYCNLVYTPQFQWFVKQFDMDEPYVSERIKAMVGESYSKGSRDNVASSLKNIFTKTPFGVELGFAYCETKKSGKNESLISLTRTIWKNPDPKVILYSLYKFAETCGNYHQFTLKRLMDHEVDSDGISPTQIFGLDEDTMTGLLIGLSNNHSDFITVGFTHDLDNINLNNEKTSVDVLGLF